MEYDVELDFPGMKRLLKSQERIRWRLFLDGYLALEWIKVQQICVDWVGGRKSDSKWVEDLIR